VTLEQDLGDRSDPLPLPGTPLPLGVSGADGHLHVVEAGDFAAGRTDKVRVLVVMMAATACRGFEPPDPVAEFDASHEFCLGELRQVSVDRGPIEAEFVEGLADFGMRPWAGSSLEMPEHSHSGRGAPQAGTADSPPQLLISL
jgi:hypothetical protein